MITQLDVALCTASCVVWNKATSQAHVFRSLAVSIVSSHVQHSFRGTLQVPFSLDGEEAEYVIHKALQQYQIQEQEQASTILNLDLEHMLTRNAFLQVKQGRVLLNAQQLLHVASKTLQFDAAPDKMLNRVCEILTAGGVTVHGYAEHLVSFTVQQLLSDTADGLDVMIQRGQAQVESGLPVYITDPTATTTTSSPPAASQPPAGQPAAAATAEEHWPCLPAAGPAPSASLRAHFATTKPISTTTSHPATDGTSSGAASLPTSEAGTATSALPSSVGAGEDHTAAIITQGSTSPKSAPHPGSNPTTGFRAHMKCGYGDDSLLWGPLLDTVHDVTSRDSEYTLPVKGGDELLEVLSLTLACCTVFPCTTGSQVYRLVLTMALVNCPAEIAEINRGRHRCLKTFVEKLTYWCNRRLAEHGVHKSDLMSANAVFEDDPFFFLSKLKGETRTDWVVLKLRQLAAVAVRLAEAPTGRYPSLPFPPTLANFDPSLQHNQSKPSFSVIQRLLQPPTKEVFSLAALDVLQRFSANASTEEVNELLSIAVANATKPGNSTKWPPPLLSVPASTSLAAARKEQAAAGKSLQVDRLLDGYRASHPSTSGAPRCSILNSNGGLDDSSAVKNKDGIVGADYIDEPRVTSGKKHAAGGGGGGGNKKGGATAAAAQTGGPAAAAAKAKIKARKAALEALHANSFGLLEQHEEVDDHDDHDDEDEDDEQFMSPVAMSSPRSGPPPASPPPAAGHTAPQAPTAHRSTSSPATTNPAAYPTSETAAVTPAAARAPAPGADTAIIEKHRWLLSMAGLDGSDSSDDDHVQPVPSPTLPPTRPLPDPTAAPPAQPAATRKPAVTVQTSNTFVYGLNGNGSSPHDQAVGGSTATSPGFINVPLDKLFAGSAKISSGGGGAATAAAQPQAKSPSIVTAAPDDNANHNSLFSKRPPGFGSSTNSSFNAPANGHNHPDNGTLRSAADMGGFQHQNNGLYPPGGSVGAYGYNQNSGAASGGGGGGGSYGPPQPLQPPAYPGAFPGGSSNPFTHLPHDPLNPYSKPSPTPNNYGSSPATGGGGGGGGYAGMPSPNMGNGGMLHVRPLHVLPHVAMPGQVPPQQTYGNMPLNHPGHAGHPAMWAAGGGSAGSGAGGGGSHYPQPGYYGAPGGALNHGSSMMNPQHHHQQQQQQQGIFGGGGGGVGGGGGGGGAVPQQYNSIPPGGVNVNMSQARASQPSSHHGSMGSPRAAGVSHHPPAVSQPRPVMVTVAPTQPVPQSGAAAARQGGKGNEVDELLDLLLV